MLKKIEELKRHSIDEILKDGPLSKLLLKVYSTLFLKGGPPNLCASCMRDYYKKIITKGPEMAKVLNQTFKFKPNEEGLKQVAAVFDKSGKMIASHRHILTDMLSDEDCIKALKIGQLKESMFLTLPKGYKNETEEAKSPKEAIKEAIKDGDGNALIKLAKKFKLVKGNPSKKDAIEALKDYIENK